MKKYLLILVAIATLISCSKKQTVNNIEQPIKVGTTAVAIGYDKFLPAATAFRMSGDYSDNVAITLNQEGQLLYFPAPTDITADSRPIDLGNGWWLNCQGLGPNSVFTKYTFAQYSELPNVPSPNQLKLDVIPGAKVTGFIELPMKKDYAVTHLDEVREYIKKL